jgi:hypothetical protein
MQYMLVTCFYSVTQLPLYNNENPQRVDCDISSAYMNPQHALLAEELEH